MTSRVLNRYAGTATRTIPTRSVLIAALAMLLIGAGPPSARAGTPGMRTLTGHVPDALSKDSLTPLSDVPADTTLNLAIGLNPRDQDSLIQLFQEIYDPTSPKYHQFLDPEQFTERFGPTESEYEQVASFAAASGLTVTRRYPNRLVLDVSGKASDIEKAFHLTLHAYAHPTEHRRFYATDTEPLVEAGSPIRDIEGLDNFVLPHPMLHRTPNGQLTGPHSATGSGPSGYYLGNDFRTAYAPDVTQQGTGQVVGLVEGEGYYASDITSYETLSGISAVPLQNVLLDGFTGTPTSTDTLGVAECSLDIEMVIAMAQGLNKVVVWEGNIWNDILNSMAGNSGFKQLSSSWAFGNENATSDTILLQMAVQGQSFLQASGDGDAWVGQIWWPGDDLYVTSCGGTTLTMLDGGLGYYSEQVWNSGDAGTGKGWCCNPDPNTNTYWGSGGGFSRSYSIPTWQQSVNMANNGGSTTFRNVPDVAMVGNQVWVTYMHGLSGSFEGTSIAAPLWAGFAALANQRAAAIGQPGLGFLNPALYSIGLNPSTNSCFHDITVGNNFSALSPASYQAVAGYDLCTGWGTPAGMRLIDALMSFSGATWVDFNYTGSTQNGTYTFPYKTLSQGIAAVSAGGNLWIKTSGTAHDTGSFTKAMTVHAYNGSVIIGR